MSKKPVLGYWKIRGLTQPIRFLLAYSGTEYEEKNYLASNNEWFDEKFSLGFDFPNLPYYDDGEVKLTQSGAILRHLARKHKLYGKNDKEAAVIDMLALEAFDLHMAYAKCVYNPDFENLKADHLKAAEKKLELFEKYLGDKKFFAGDISFADFHLYEIISAHRVLAPELVAKFKKVTKFLDRFEALPAIKAYMGSPGYIKGPQNGPSAKFGGK